MSDTTESDQAPSNVAAPATAPWQRWIAPGALLVAVIACVLAILALTGSSSSSAQSKSTTAQSNLPGDPKARVCSAFDSVTKAVQLQTHANLGKEPVPVAAVAANARLALVGGGQYLMSRLDAATPQALADPVRAFANNLQDIGINALAGATNADAHQADLLKQADTTRKQITDLCK